MHKRRVNEWVLNIVIEPVGPILIKSGEESGADPTLPDMNFVRTRHPISGERTIYLPGSSLKGALRSHAERIIRTVKGESPTICCDPLHRRASCGNRTRDIKDTARQYKSLCLACRTFGHTVQASHFFIADAYPDQALDRLSVRHQVAIDRLSGGVAVGPFELEVAEQGRFETRLMLVNFECWQLGLVALALRDLAEGRLLLGYGKSRGLGQVRAYLGRMEIAYPGHFEADHLTRTLYGVGALAPDLVSAYGYVAGDQAALPEGGMLVPESAAWGRPAVCFGAPGDAPLLALESRQLQSAHAQIAEVLKAMMPAWADYRPGGGEASHA
jgi:CRISPR-associated RAMP protein (TIGR02581 family)